MGEFRVHHVRFFEFAPTAIQCMAYNTSTRRLALSRSDGSIELWSVADKWFQEEVIPGCAGQSVEALVWQGNRLFSGGLDGNVSEIDLVRLQIKASSPSNAGPIWCLTSNAAGNQLAAGTEDGCVVLWSTEGDGLEYSKRFETQESRILSISWHPNDDVIVTGGVDNIRLWSPTSGRAIQRLTLARQEHSKETVVWCVAILSDMTIVSGDSRGKTTFWNGRQGTVIKSLQSHKADVNCLAVSQSENTVVTSGVDSSIMQFDFIAPRGNSDWRDWVGTLVHGRHSHDVRALQIIEDNIVSGGVDTTMIVNPMDTKNRNKAFRRYRGIPHKPLVKVAHDVNVMLLKYPERLEVWRLGYTDKTGVNGEILPLRSNPVKLIQMKTKGGCPVYCCDISHDASVLGYSDGDSLRCYRITLDNLQSIQPDVAMARLSQGGKEPPEGAHCMCFTSKGDNLVTVTSTSQLQLCDISDGTVSVEHTFPQLSESLHLLAVSADDTMAAVADHHGNTFIYNLHTKQHICNTPRNSSQVSALVFSPDSRCLATAHADLKIFEFSIHKKELTAWSKRWSHQFLKVWMRRHNKFPKIAYNPSNPHQLMVHDDQMFCLLDKKKQFPNVHSWMDLCNLKDNNPFHISTKYKYLLHVEILPNNWLVAVERPPLEMTAHLPNALRKKKFGT